MWPPLIVFGLTGKEVARIWTEWRKRGEFGIWRKSDEFFGQVGKL